MPAKVLKPKPEKPAEQNEASFRLLFKSHPVPMWVYDLKTLAFLEVNDAAVEKYGYTRAEFLRLTLKDICPVEDVSRLVEDGKKKRPILQHSGEWRHRLKDGRIVDVEISSQPIDFSGREAALVMASDISERKRAEQALAASEAELRALFASMQDVVLVIDRDGVYRKIAPTNPALLVKPPEELLGKNLRDIFPAKQAETFLSVMWQVLETHQSARIEYELLISERPTWFAAAISPMDENSTLWVARDITERKQAEEALRESETHYRAVVEGTPVIVYSFSNKRGGVYYSEHVVDILGYSPEQLYAQPMLWRNSIHPDDLSSLDQRNLIAVAGKTVRVEYRIRDAHGNWHWFEDRAFKYQMDDSEFIIEGRALDITERRQTEAALHESEERYHSLFDRIMDGIYRSTHAGKFVDVNPAMVRMFGYASKEELLNADIKKELYFAPDERGSHVLDTGQEETEIYRMRRKDGSEIWVEDHGTYVHDEQGMVIYHEGILRDITERKLAEDSLETAHRKLQQSLEREQQLARTDGLTGLYNYRHFFELASHEFSAALRYQRPLAILMFDLDYLKRVNDSLGHLAGDRMLALAAQTAAAQMRAVDVLARYGGDEFVVLLPQTNARQALLIAERIRTSIAAVHMETDKGPLGVTLSIGIAEIQRTPEDENVERLVQRADQAMYAAKHAGRNRTVIFEK